MFHGQIRDFLVKQGGEEYQIEKVSKKTLEENQKKEASFDFDAVESLSTESILKARKEHKDLLVIGSIVVPSVSIQLPIFKGCSNENLLYGAGTLSPNQKMGEGNYALASHRTSNPNLLFTPLDRLSLGAEIYLVGSDKIFVYQATYKERVSPTKVELLEEEKGKKKVTLITCGEMEGQTRLVVQGELKEIRQRKEK
ncbi:class A sortase [Enterococcus faecium]|nr:class A sortase [Enterococcus faecium]